MAQMQRQPVKPCPGLEAGEYQFVKRDDRKAVDCHPERVMVKQGNAEQCESEEDEIDRHRPDRRTFGSGAGRERGNAYKD